MRQWNVQIGNNFEVPTRKIGSIKSVLRFSNEKSHATIAGISVQNTFEQIGRLIPPAIGLAVQNVSSEQNSIL